ncbi:hypothetical protein BV25DRAFT_1417148 [Artomyces pyxidatus]|uniref:Uncharacterized protein n=1 Tax=Artomyces pyxidatus TaxID=48021 RepID=A0ACB8TE50_9AGAM|nr:hypothetical protein BV25DRAFT_1417148 [Artomyces pyxidatus]
MWMLIAHEESTTDNGGWVHYLWSAPTITLVVVSSGLSAAIAAMDFSLKRLEPYRRLSQGRVSANHSLLLDYVSMPHFIAPQKAFRNRHYIVMASSVATLLSLVLSPLASSVFVVRAAQLHQGISGFISQSVGFSAQWDALIPAYNAVNAVASMFLSEGTPPQYVYASWAFPAFELFYEPTPGISDNGNFTVELPTIVTEDGCEETNITYQDQGPGNSSFRYLATVTGVRSGATFTVELPGFGTTQYNGSIAPFNNQTDPRRQSFVYTIYTPLTEDESESDTAGPANMSAMICSPTIYLQNTVAFMGASTREVWGVLSPADSVKQPLDILNGSAAAFNGYYFDTSKYGPIVGE